MKAFIIKVGKNKFKITNQGKLYFFSRGGTNAHHQSFTIKEIENERVYTKYVTDDMKWELISNIESYKQAVKKFQTLKAFI